MIDSLLRKDVQDFIHAHEQDDEKKLILQHKTILGVPSSRIAAQITGRRKSKTKIPLYYNTEGIVYPSGVNLEQSSSERTALLKAQIVKSLPGTKNTFADLTGGFGVDTLFLSSIFTTAIYVEPDAMLMAYAHHNHKTLGAVNITYHSATAAEFLESTQSTFDCVFIDPSRRNKTNQKIFKLTDCEPDVCSLLPLLLERTSYVLLKTSPLLDIQKGIQELQSVECVYVVSVDNECKELLFLCNKQFHDEPKIIAINLTQESQLVQFKFSEEKECVASFSESLTYLYEPNASILKSGAFKLITKTYPVHKIHRNTHLYTSSALVNDFPGRIFKIIQAVKPDSKTMKEFFLEGKANVITRNYPLSTEALKKKLKLKDGGEQYLIAFSGESKKYLVAASRVA
jgi:16S rRNA G966 N2-methylase RsmD